MDAGTGKCSPWREWEFWLIAALVAAIYFSRVADLPIRGEETRRAMVAWETLQTGDWIVPQQQGQPFLSRPPVGSWPIAWTAWALGDLSLWAVRLPTVLATLLTTLLVYAYSRQFLARYAALCAGLAYATGIQVLQLGRVAETEATFTLLLSAALLVWHWGYTARWSASRTWYLAYALVAIATLVKSMQAPVYFCGAVGLFLIWQRDWKFLISKTHAAGLCVFAVLFAAWQLPFYWRMGAAAVHDVWSGDVGLRFADVTLKVFFTHLLTYPIEVGAALCPWALLLPAYIWPQFRRTIGAAKPMVVFLAIAWLVALPTCWLVPNARPRYIMPLYPLAAPLVGLVVQRLTEIKTVPVVRLGWLCWIGGLMFAAIGGGAVVAAASWNAKIVIPAIHQTPWFAAIYLAAALCTAAVLAMAWRRWTPTAVAASALAVAGLLGLSASGVVVNSLVELDPGTGAQIAELKTRLPNVKPLASLGQVGTMFSYYWRDPIRVVSQAIPTNSNEVPGDVDCFCFNWTDDPLPQLPFPWRVEAILHCNREIESGVESQVVVGRRVDVVALAPDETEFRE
ncbi:MAG TPA: glycosyltransferase family 39 protein [Pirellulales bacterium]|jgi:4-amino-4-deoxy-L-arabinose transferase-like glycosyltransferase